MVFFFLPSHPQGPKGEPGEGGSSHAVRLTQIPHCCVTLCAPPEDFWLYLTLPPVTLWLLSPELWSTGAPRTSRTSRTRWPSSESNYRINLSVIWSAGEDAWQANDKLRPELHNKQEARWWWWTVRLHQSKDSLIEFFHQVEAASFFWKETVSVFFLAPEHDLLLYWLHFTQQHFTTCKHGLTAGH